MPIIDLHRRPLEKTVSKFSAEKQPPEFFSRRVRTAKRYFLDLAPQNRDLAVVCGGYEQCDSNYFVRRVDFPYYVLEWNLHGKGRVRLGKTWHELKAGTLFCYGPGLAHEIVADVDQPLAKHFVSLVGNSARTLLESAGLSPGTVIQTPAGLDLLWVFEAFLRDGQRSDSASDELCEMLARYLLAKFAASSMKAAESDTGSHATFLRCDSILAANAERLSSLTQLAEECGVDSAYLCRLYKRYGGQTPYQRLTRLKMNLAAERLLADEISVREVAASLGFSDPFHFSRSFKSVFGVAPSVFRQLK